MKKIFLGIFLITGLCFGEDDALTILPRQTKKIPPTNIQKTERVVGPTRKSLDSEIVSALDRINETGKNIDKALGDFSKRPAIWDYSSSFDLKRGTVIRGILLNSVVSTNIESPIWVEVLEGEALPSGTQFNCGGVTENKRVNVLCSSMNASGDGGEEYNVKVGILNMDGSLGLKADEVYTGKEEYVTGTVLSAFAKGMTEASMDKVSAPYGELMKNTTKNKLLGGALTSADEVTDIMKNEMRSKEPKAYIKAGKRVLIYFKERFKI